MANIRLAAQQTAPRMAPMERMARPSGPSMSGAGRPSTSTLTSWGLRLLFLQSPPRVDPWEYNKELYKRRNEVERLFRRLKGFRRIFSRFDKLEVFFLGFILVALIFDALRSLNTP